MNSCDCFIGDIVRPNVVLFYVVLFIYAYNYVYYYLSYIPISKNLTLNVGKQVASTVVTSELLQMPHYHLATYKLTA